MNEAVEVLKATRERVLKSITHFEDEAAILDESAKSCRLAADEHRDKASDLLTAINQLEGGR